MSQEQTAINDKAIRTQAERLTATGWDGDAHRFVESLLLNAIADGWRRIEAPPPLRGRGSSDEARHRLVEDTKRQLAEQMRNRATADPNGVTR